MTIIARPDFSDQQLKILYYLISFVPLFEWIPICLDFKVVTLFRRMCSIYVSAFSGFQLQVNNIPKEDLQ